MEWPRKRGCSFPRNIYDYGYNSQTMKSGVGWLSVEVERVHQRCVNEARREGGEVGPKTEPAVL